MTTFRHNRIRALAASACFGLLLLGPVGEAIAQRPLPPRLRPNNRPLVRKLLQQRARQRDPQAMEMLRRMAQARIAFSGEQITEVAERGMQTSRMRVWGDARGRIRRDYIEPDSLEGDMMLIAPNQYRYYHKRGNVVDIALWPTPFNEREKRVFRLIAQGALSVQKVGEEVIAGRNAAIVLVSAPGGPNAPARQMKFWIDQTTGLQLKNEISNAMGLVSRSYMTSIQIGPEANVLPRLFEPAFLQTARPNPLFPPTSQYRTVEEAQDKLPFTPLQSSALPSGFKLTGVWIIGPDEAHPKAAVPATILLRYSDGVGSFSLYQRQSRGQAGPFAGKKNAAMLRRSIQHWRIERSNNPAMDIIYIGQLPPQQVSALYDSLH